MKWLQKKKKEFYSIFLLSVLLYSWVREGMYNDNIIVSTCVNKVKQLHTGKNRSGDIFRLRNKKYIKNYQKKKQSNFLYRYLHFIKFVRVIFFLKFHVAFNAEVTSKTSGPTLGSHRADKRQ